MKFLAMVFIAVLSFVLALAGAMAYTGNLNKEGVDRLLGKTAKAAQPEPPPGPDDLSAAAKALKEREAELDKREAALAEEQKRLSETQSQMDELRGTLQQLLNDLTKSVDKSDADEAARLKSVADSLAAMKPAQAALALEDWPPEQGAQLLQLIDEGARGKILDGMDQQKATALLRAMADQQAAAAPPAQ